MASNNTFKVIVKKLLKQEQMRIIGSLIQNHDFNDILCYEALIFSGAKATTIVMTDHMVKTVIIQMLPLSMKNIVADYG